MKTDAPSPGGPNPGTRSHVAREHFVYIKLLALEAQELNTPTFYLDALQ